MVYSISRKNSINGETHVSTNENVFGIYVVLVIDLIEHRIN